MEELPIQSGSCPPEQLFVQWWQQFGYGISRGNIMGIDLAKAAFAAGYNFALHRQFVPDEVRTLWVRNDRGLWRDEEGTTRYNREVQRMVYDPLRIS